MSDRSLNTIQLSLKLSFMKHLLFVTFFSFTGICFLLTSCEVEHRSEKTPLSAQASVDYSKTHEMGVSELEYDPSVGTNVLIWTEIGIIGGPGISVRPHLGGILSVDDEYDTPAKDSKGSLSIKTGLGYVMKGQKFKDSDTKFTFHYLELPIFALYHYRVNETGGLYAGLGPYFAYGLGGKMKSQNFSESVFGRDNGGYKRFDAGLGFKAGYEFKSGLFADITYELGLANLVYAEADVKSHMRCSSLSIGYVFGSLAHKEKKK